MSEETVSVRLFAKLCEQAGTLSANVLELQIRLQDQMETNAAQAQAIHEQSEAIKSRDELLKAVREERDNWRALAEPGVRTGPKKGR